MWNSSHHRAIIHLDSDAFFASCEQAIHPELKGKPVITGKERGIVAAASYEAKAYGVQRGVTLSDAIKMCPGLVVLPSDYETYSLFSRRMFSILRRFSSVVEEYGIDEGFIDITGLRRPMHQSYEQMARTMKEQVEQELGISVSVGLAPTKVLAKVGSKWNKPSGCVFISAENREAILKQLLTEKVWGIGPNTAAHMAQLGIITTFDFAERTWAFVEKHFTKPHQEIWYELNGTSVLPVITEEKTTYASISKTKTFTPPRSDKTFVYAQLVKNLENACIKARRYGLAARRVTIFLKQQDFSYHGLEAELTRASCYPNEILKAVEPMFESLFKSNVTQAFRPDTIANHDAVRPKGLSYMSLGDTSTQYRATGIVLADLQENTRIQDSLFAAPIELSKLKRVYDAVDVVSGKFGKHSLHLGASLSANASADHLGGRGDKTTRKLERLKGETTRQFLNIPRVFGVVK